MNHPRIDRAVWGALLAASVALAAPRAHASCGAESCALDNFANRGRRLSFELAFQSLDQDQPRIGTRSAQVGELPGHHDEVETRSRLVTARAQIALTPRWSINATVPYMNRVHRHILNEEALPPELLTWRYQGIGDAALTVNAVALGTSDPSSPLTVILQGGAKLPTGSRHVDAVNGHEPEPHARLGTGSWDLLVGGHVMHFVSAPSLSGSTSSLPLFASAMLMRPGRGTDNYRVGSMFDATLGTAYPLVDRLQLLAQGNLRVRERDDAGVAPDDPAAHEALETQENTGGTSVYASPGLRFVAGPALDLSAYLQVPLYQRVNGIQLVAPYHFWLGATYKLH